MASSRLCIYLLSYLLVLNFRQKFASLVIVFLAFYLSSSPIFASRYPSNDNQLPSTSASLSIEIEPKGVDVRGLFLQIPDQDIASSVDSRGSDLRSSGHPLSSFEGEAVYLDTDDGSSLRNSFADTTQYFMLFQTKTPVTVRANFGPLLTSKVVYPGEESLSGSEEGFTEQTESPVNSYSKKLPDDRFRNNNNNHHHHRSESKTKSSSQTNIDKFEDDYQDLGDNDESIEDVDDDHEEDYDLETDQTFNQLSSNNKKSEKHEDKVPTVTKSSAISVKVDRKIGRVYSERNNQNSNNSHHSMQSLNRNHSIFHHDHHQQQQYVHQKQQQYVPRIRILSPSETSDISSYLITRDIEKSSPVVRVLFYAGRAIPPKLTSSHQYRQQERSNICPVVVVTKEGERVFGLCSLSASDSGQGISCVSDVTLPASWFPTSSSISSSNPIKPSSARVDYFLMEFLSSMSCQEYLLKSTSQTDFMTRYLTGINTGILSPSSLTPIQDVVLCPTKPGTFEEVTNDDIIHILIPTQSYYPNGRMYIPVLYRHPFSTTAGSAFSVRIRIRSGIKVLGAHLSGNSHWQISIENNSTLKGRTSMNTAVVTAYLRDEDLQVNDIMSLSSISSAQTSKQSASSSFEKKPQASVSSSVEVFSWLLQVDDSALESSPDSGRISWQVDYIKDFPLQSEMSAKHSSGKHLTRVKSGDQYNHHNPFRRISKHPEADSSVSKLTCKIVMKKDEVHSVIGVSRVKEIVNLASLTGRQQSQVMRVFAVSHSGREGDVTLSSSCLSDDESVLKVSPSCTSIYVDGSELRSSTNASVIIKYGSLYGTTSFFVWMPKFPLEVSVSDSKLSQIRSWKIPSFDGHQHSLRHRRKVSTSHHFSRKRRSSFPNDDSNCRLRYQQTYVRISTRFYSKDHESGREFFLLNRRISFQVTDLVIPFMSITSPSVASLHPGSNIIEGVAPGKTAVQVVSPASNKVIGEREIVVSSDKESITKLEVNLVTGLTLDVSSWESIYAAKVTMKDSLRIQYQEGILDVKVHFSDGSIASLSDISPTDYHMSVDVFENKAVAFAPNQGLPRIIALNEGRDQLIHVSLEVPNVCQRKRTQQLAMKYITLNVDLSSDTLDKSSFLENNPSSGNSLFPETFIRKNSRSPISSGKNFLKEVLLLNAKNNHKNVALRGRLDHSLEKTSSNSMTILEIGMYALLVVFCLAMTGFVASCLIFVIKIRSVSSSDQNDALEKPVCIRSSSTETTSGMDEEKDEEKNSRNYKYHHHDHQGYHSSQGYPYHSHHHHYRRQKSHLIRQEVLGQEKDEEAVPVVSLRTTSSPKEAEGDKTKDWVFLGKATLDRHHHHDNLHHGHHQVKGRVVVNTSSFLSRSSKGSRVLEKQEKKQSGKENSVKAKENTPLLTSVAISSTPDLTSNHASPSSSITSSTLLLSNEHFIPGIKAKINVIVNQEENDFISQEINDSNLENETKPGLIELRRNDHLHRHESPDKTESPLNSFDSFPSTSSNGHSFDDKRHERLRTKGNLDKDSNDILAAAVNASSPPPSSSSSSSLSSSVSSSLSSSLTPVSAHSSSLNLSNSSSCVVNIQENRLSDVIDIVSRQDIQDSERNEDDDKDKSCVPSFLPSSLPSVPSRGTKSTRSSSLSVKQDTNRKRRGRQHSLQTPETVLQNIPRDLRVKKIYWTEKRSERHNDFPLKHTSSLEMTCKTNRELKLCSMPKKNTESRQLTSTKDGKRGSL